jgi:hypothetical protein
VFVDLVLISVINGTRLWIRARLTAGLGVHVDAQAMTFNDVSRPDGGVGHVPPGKKCSSWRLRRSFGGKLKLTDRFRLFSNAGAEPTLVGGQLRVLFGPGYIAFTREVCAVLQFNR